MTGAIRVTVVDLETGDTDTADIQPGQYIVVCAKPAHVAHEQVYPLARTTVVTIKQWRAGHG